MDILRFLGLDRLNLLPAEAKRLIGAFTVIETVILTLWLDALGIGLGLLPDNQLLAAGILFVGLLVEHLIAGVAGKV